MEDRDVLRAELHAVLGAGEEREMDLASVRGQAEALTMAQQQLTRRVQCMTGQVRDSIIVEHALNVHQHFTLQT